MDYNIISVLPRLKSKEKEMVNKWYDDFDNVIKMGRITDVETIYRLVYLVTEGEVRSIIQELNNSLEGYPTLLQMKKSLLTEGTYKNRYI